MSALEILAVIGVVVFVIYQQVAGQKIAGKRLIVLPGVLTVVGFADLHGARGLDHADYVWLAVGAAGSLVIGLAFGVVTRVGSRDGVLWAKLPVWGLLLWVAMIGFRVLVMVAAHATGAHVAASATPLLFTLGLNRLGQAAVIAVRAMAAGIPFAPEKDGSTFLGGTLAGTGRNRNRSRSRRY